MVGRSYTLRSRRTTWPPPPLTCGQVNDSHRAVRGVDALPPGTPGPEGVDAKVLRVDMDVQLGAEGERLLR